MWREWKRINPDSEILSLDTGFVRPYGRDPYASYYAESLILFQVEKRDDRIHPKTVVCGVEAAGAYKAYEEDDLVELGVLEDVVGGGVDIRLEWSDQRSVKVTNLDTGGEIVTERVFWFAWHACHPETELYTKSG